MPYIGKQPEHGRFAKLDQINSGFNGSAVTFNLTVDSVAVYPTNPQNLLVSLGGVVQQPGTDYTVSAATLTFTTAPAASVGFFGVLLGDVLDIGTPSDSSVTVSKMAANSVDSAQYVDGSIDLVHMSAESVDSDQYVDGSIDRVHLAADIIDGTKIADDVINSEHYAAASIDNEHLADDAVGVAELSATGTASSSTFLRGDNAWSAAGVSTKSGAFTKDTSNATGTNAYTGVGFEPKAVFFFAHCNTFRVSLGFSDGTDDGVVLNNHGDTATNWGNAARVIQLVTSSSVNYLGVVNSFDADGFTIGWTKTGAMSGTAQVYYLAIG